MGLDNIKKDIGLNRFFHTVRGEINFYENGDERVLITDRNITYYINPNGTEGIQIEWSF